MYVAMSTEKLLNAEAKIDKSSNYKMDILWQNVVLMMTLHILGLYGLYLKKTETFAISNMYAIFLGILSGFGITAGSHRLWTHRSYKANYLVQIILMAFASLTYQNSIYVWCRDHRVHHKFSETDADPHNAKRGFFFSHIGWLMVRKHPDVLRLGKTVDLSDLEANPLIMFHHKYYYYFIIFTAFVIPSIIPWYFWNETIRSSIFGIGFYRYLVNTHATWSVNSFAHLFGPKPYDKQIGPVENQLVVIATMGEGYHNYHHTFPYDYKASEYGSFSANWTTGLIDFFGKLGWVTDRKTATEEHIKKRKEESGDGSRFNILKPYYFLFNFLALYYIF